jgi:hypothetical protein
MIEGATKAENVTWLNIDGDDGRLYVASPDGSDTINKYDREGKKTGEVKGDKYADVTAYITGTKIKEYEAEPMKYKKLMLFMETVSNHDKLGISFAYPGSLSHKVIELLPSIDLSIPVTISAYKKGEYTNIAFKQNGEQVASKYMEFTQEKDGSWKRKELNGYPKKKADLSESEYKRYRLDVEDFLAKVYEEQEKRFEGYTTTQKEAEAMVQNDKVDVSPDDIPF